MAVLAGANLGGAALMKFKRKNYLVLALYACKNIGEGTTANQKVFVVEMLTRRNQKELRFNYVFAHLNNVEFSPLLPAFYKLIQKIPA